jgi:hypothetical protein
MKLNHSDDSPLSANSERNFMFRWKALQLSATLIKNYGHSISQVTGQSALIDSCLSALSKIFSVQVHRTERWTGNSQKSAKDGAVCRSSREFTDERFVRSDCTQRSSCRTLQRLSIDINDINFKTNGMYYFGV